MTRPPLRIVHCLRAPVGGLFRHVCDLAASQAAAGHAVGVIAAAGSGGQTADARLAALADACELGVARLTMRRMPGPGDLAAMRAIARQLAAWQPDVVHGHGAKGGAYARLAAPHGALRVYTPHGGSLHYAPGTPAGAVYLRLERWLLRRTDLVLFESAYGWRTYESRVAPPGCPARVVHNGVGPADFEAVSLAAEAGDFVFVGELRMLKGIDVLIEAMSRLAAAGRDARATIVGDGPDAARLRAMAAESGAAGALVFRDAMPARAAFALGRCVVLPSRAESLPYAALEAAAAGRPLIATDVGGLGEIFGADSGLLVPPGDAAALAAAMGRAMDAPAAADAAAERLRARVARDFSLATMTEAATAAYGEGIRLKPS